MNTRSILDDPVRVAVVQAATLLDTSTQRALDRLAHLASRTLRAPVALASLVDSDRQCFIGQSGLAEPFASKRVTPLSHSFCKHVVATGEALIVENAPTDERVRGNQAIEALNVIAYAGLPITAPGGEVLGSFCAIDSLPRTWRAEDLDALADFAATVQAIVEAHVERLHRRESEDQVARLKRMHSLGQLAAGVAHDFNNLLQAVQGNADLLLEFHPNNPDVKERVAAILNATASGQRLTGQLTRFMTSPAVVDDRTDLGAALDSLRPVLEQLVGRAIQLEVDRPECALPVALANGEFEQLLLNLVGNARDALDGRTAARVKVQLTKTGDERVRLLVADNGTGMDPAFAARVLEPFVTSKGRDDAGTGLGLSIVYGIVTSAGGDIELDSAPGAGTTVRIDLPLVDDT